MNHSIMPFLYKMHISHNTKKQPLHCMAKHRIEKPENQPIFCYIYQKLKYLTASLYYYPQQYISTEFSVTTEHLQYIDINL